MQKQQENKITLNVNFSSKTQSNVFLHIMENAKRTVLLRGGSGGGKTWVALMIVFFRALQNPNTEHYLLKTDKGILKTAFEKIIIGFLQQTDFVESENRKKNKTWFYDQQKGELILANGSIIFIRPIRSPHPSNSRGDSALLGMNAETIYLDESTTIGFAWYEFLETRVRSAHRCKPLILMTENPDARSWTHQYFDLKINPQTYEPITEAQFENSEILRIEAWDNKLQDELYLNILKNSGNAERFFYGSVVDLPDFSKIYTYNVDNFVSRFFYIYSIDPGYTAHTGCTMLGFGGDYNVHVHEIAYNQGFTQQDFYNLVQKIIDIHADIYNQITEVLLPGQILRLRRLQIIPHIIIDCARVDLIDDLNKKFNFVEINGRKSKIERAMFIASLKGEKKYYSLERVKKLSRTISPESKNLLKELSAYRYSNQTDEGIPDGNDDLCDSMLYGQRYILEKVFDKYPNLLIFDKETIQIGQSIKNINPLRILKK